MKRLLLLAVCILIAVAFWLGFKLGQRDGRTEATRDIHGLCNVGVGQPYEELMSHLNDLNKQGKHDEVGRKLDIAAKHTRDIYSVWLGKDRKVYADLVVELTNTNATPNNQIQNIGTDAPNPDF